MPNCGSVLQLVANCKHRIKWTPKHPPSSHFLTWTSAEHESNSFQSRSTSNHKLRHLLQLPLTEFHKSNPARSRKEQTSTSDDYNKRSVEKWRQCLNWNRDEMSSATKFNLATVKLYAEQCQNETCHQLTVSSTTTSSMNARDGTLSKRCQS